MKAYLQSLVSMKARIRIGAGLLLALKAMLVLSLAGGIFAVTAYFSMQKAIFGTGVRVPRILEMELETATTNLEPLDLRVEEIATRHDDLVPAGRILSQEPPPD